MQFHLQVEFFATRVNVGEEDGVPTQWVVASLNAFYRFLIFVDLSAFMFSKQKTDLEPSCFYLTQGVPTEKYYRKQDGRGFWSEGQRQMDSHTPEMYQLLK